MNHARWIMVLLAVATALALSGCGRFDGEAHVSAHNGVLLLESQPRYGQTFQPASEEVAGVDLLLATYGRQVDGTLTVRLRDGIAGPVVGTAEVDGTSILDNRWVTARFTPPIAVPPAPYFDLSWDGGQELGVYANVTPPEVTVHDVNRGERLLNAAYAGGSLVRDGVPAPGDLAFHARGTDPWQVPRTLARAAAHTGRVLLGTPLFLAAWLLLLALGAALVAGRRPARAPSDTGSHRP